MSQDIIIDIQRKRLTEPKNGSSDLTRGSLAYAYAHVATSANTRQAYRSDIRHFIAWGGVLPATPDVIIHYLEACAELYSVSTLKRRLTAIKNWHTYQGFQDPTVHPLIRKTLSGISRVHGKAADKAKALSVEQLVIISQHLLRKGRTIDLRDNALLQLGFFGAFRRSELVAIHWEHVNFVPEGVEILIARSKTDQEGKGQICAIPYGNTTLCPVTALKQWQDAVRCSSGPVFVRLTKGGRLLSKVLSSSYVTKLLKRYAEECHFPNPEEFSAHSLRRGFATSASKKGADLISIMRHGRWRTERTVLGYIEEGQRFDENVAGLLLGENS